MRNLFDERWIFPYAENRMCARWGRVPMCCASLWRRITIYVKYHCWCWAVIFCSLYANFLGAESTNRGSKNETYTRPLPKYKNAAGGILNKKLHRMDWALIGACMEKIKSALLDYWVHWNDTNLRYCKKMVHQSPADMIHLGLILVASAFFCSCLNPFTGGGKRCFLYLYTA